MLFTFGERTQLTDITIPLCTTFRYTVNGDEKYIFGVKNKKSIKEFRYASDKEQNINSDVQGYGITLYRAGVRVCVGTEGYLREQPHDEHPDLFMLLDDGTLYLSAKKLATPIQRLSYMPKSNDCETGIYLVYKGLPMVVNDRALAVKSVRRKPREHEIRIPHEKGVVLIVTLADDDRLREDYPLFVAKNELFKIDV